MAKKWKKVAALAVATVMGATTLSGLLTACKNDDKPSNDGGIKQGTYRTFTSTMPSNWNELTYQDNNDTQILDYIQGSLFTFDYDFGGNKFNADGTVNYGAIVEGGFTTQYDAATKVEDVTATVDAKWGYTAAQKADGGYAYKITLREDLKWDDGTPIDAGDFIYSMQEQLDPDFMNFRANSYYQSIRIINAKNYFYKNTAATYETIGSQGYASNQAAVDAGADIYVDAYGFWNAQGYVDKDGNPITQWLSRNDTTEYDAPDVWAAYAEYDTDDKKAALIAEQGLVYRENLDDGKGGTYNTWANGTDPEAEGYKEYGDTEDVFASLVESDRFSAKDLWDYYLSPTGAYAAYVEIGGQYENWLGIKVINTHTNVTFNDVGFYQDGDYSFVVCMEKPLTLLNDDGSLHYNAAYYFSSFPLVKEELYEKCKVAPVTGSTLWTSKYNSSLDTTASWGPYKLTDFQAGKSYTLEKNNYCYAFNMDEYKNQYNVTKITCEKLDDQNTQWMSFFNGNIDSKGLDNDHLDAYKNSKYAVFSPATYTYGLQIYGGLTALNNNGRNNSILAIPEFRQAMSLALDREYLASDVVAPNQAAYGAINAMYYYDVDGGGVYRLTDQAKEGLLRAYGYTQAADKTWSNASGTITGYSTDDAYDTLGGANMAKAKELVQAAIAKLKAEDSIYNYNPAEKITIDIGLPSTNSTYQKIFNTYKSCWEAIVEGTELEGKLDIVSSDQSANDDWSDDFRANVYDVIPTGAIGGNPFDPYDLIGCYIDSTNNLNYHPYWNTNNVDITITFGADDNPEYSGKTYTMSALNWWCCVNGLAASYTGQTMQYTYVWSNGYLSESNRLLILAALEEAVITQYQFVPLFSSYSATLLGAKFSYASTTYNQFMGFGGMRYLIVNYTDDEWKDFVDSFGTGKLEEYYKASN